MKQIQNISGVRVGAVTTTFAFFPLYPDPYGGLPPGRSVIVAGMERLKAITPYNPEIIQFPAFPDMTDGSRKAEVDHLITGLRPYGEIVPVLMFGNDPHGSDAEQEAYVTTLTNGFIWAGSHGFKNISGTFFEKWMSGNPRISDADLPAANTRLGKLIAEARKRAAAVGPIPDHIHAEYLRPDKTGGPGEFSSYTTLARAVPAILAMNEEIGGDKPFVLTLDDSAHAGDSLLTLAEQTPFIVQARDAGIIGISHISARTHRGCLLADGAYLSAWIAHRMRLKALKVLLSEEFYPHDRLLNPLRAENIGFGEDTFEGRSAERVMADGLGFTVHQLNSHFVN